MSITQIHESVYMRARIKIPRTCTRAMCVRVTAQPWASTNITVFHPDNPRPLHCFVDVTKRMESCLKMLTTSTIAYLKPRSHQILVIDIKIHNIRLIFCTYLCVRTTILMRMHYALCIYNFSKISIFLRFE